MNRTKSESLRVEELRALLAAYRQMTIEEVKETGWDDVQVEIEGELWKLEQDLYDRRRRAQVA